MKRYVNKAEEGVKLNILLITRGKLPLPNIKGGAVEYLIQLLIDENEKNWHHDITLVTCSCDGIEREQLNYRYTQFVNIKTDGLLIKIETAVRYVLNTQLHYIGNYFIAQVKKRIKNWNQYDIVLVENAPDYLPLLRNLYNGRLIFHTHNDWIDESNYKILDYCDEYWTISRYLATKVFTYGYKEKTSVLYNGIKLENYENAPEQLKNRYKQKFNISDSDKLIIYAGRLVPEKGVLQMIKAFINAKFEENVKLIIAGGTFYSNNKRTPYIKKCVEASQNKDNIIFTGYIPGNEISTLYQISNIGVVPSICNEAFGLTILEMMAVGLPIITTNRGGIPELVDEKIGFIFNPDNEIEWINTMSNSMKILIEDEEKAKKMGEIAKKKAKKFGLDKYLTRFDRLLKIDLVDE